MLLALQCAKWDYVGLEAAYLYRLAALQRCRPLDNGSFQDTANAA